MWNEEYAIPDVRYQISEGERSAVWGLQTAHYAVYNKYVNP